MLGPILDNPHGCIFLSVLLGFGLATLFRKVCKDSQCIIIQSPPLKDLEKYHYKLDGNCYKYTPEATNCAVGQE